MITKMPVDKNGLLNNNRCWTGYRLTRGVDIMVCDRGGPNTKNKYGVPNKGSCSGSRSGVVYWGPGLGSRSGKQVHAGVLNMKWYGAAFSGIGTQYRQ